MTTELSTTEVSTTESRSGLPDLALGPVRWQLTGLGRARALASVFGLYLATTAPVIYAPLIIVACLFVTDGWLSHRELSSLRLRLIPVRTRAALPERITYLATAVDGSADGVSLELGLAGGDGFGPGTRLGPDRTRVQPRVVGPASQTHQSFRTMRSMLGFLGARRDGVQLLSQRVSQAVSRHPADVQTLASARIDELAHLRPYAAGDRPNRVNWNATARTGELHVRDDLQLFDQAVIVVDLGEYVASDPANREQAVGALARLLVEEAWENGLGVRLVSRELSVGFHRYVAATKAAAQDPAFGGPSAIAGSSDVVVDEAVFDDGQLVERLGGLSHGAPVPRPNTEHYVVSKSGVVRVE